MSEKHSTLVDSLNEDTLNILASGLVSLEGALNALQQPVPPTLVELKTALALELQLKAKTLPERLDTAQVAQLLNCTRRRVRQLGKEGEIGITRSGRPGRGGSTVFSAQSVWDYLERKREGAPK